ncbi:MAG: Arm DNA-binding domain-containing protein [Paludibacteraceae bacterium]|nr:Arm DNA-binding domain-containing protein [Paludibacteraceae bacterium]
MFYYSKDLITIASILDTRTIKADGTYPIKIRETQKRVRAHYATGKSLTKEDWEKLPTNKTGAVKNLRESIENSFPIVKWNVQTMVKKGNFSFDALNCRMGKATGDTVNNALKANIQLLSDEKRIGTMRLNIQTLRLIEDFRGAKAPSVQIAFQKRKKHLRN